MSYLGTALTRLTEQHGLIQADLSRKTGLSRAHISRVCNGEAKDLSDEHFGSVLKVFASNPRSQAELIVARCMDAKEGGVAAAPSAAALVEIRVRGQTPTAPPESESPEHIHLSRETEKAFTWLRSQCPVNPDLEKHLVGYARMLGMK
jgi:transcriptional regulator with XRE-family HTH domain